MERVVGGQYIQKIGSLGKVGGQTNPTKGRETEREQGWDDWDGYGKVKYVIPSLSTGLAAQL